METELGDIAGGLDQAAIDALLLEQAPPAGPEPVIEEIELAPLLPFDGVPEGETDIGLLLDVPLSISVNSAHGRLSNSASCSRSARAGTCRTSTAAPASRSTCW